MELIAAKMFIILKMNAAGYGRKLQGLPTAQGCAVGRSDVIGLLTGINGSVRQLKSQDCQTRIEQCRRERTSADVCLKESPGYYMNLTLAMESGGMVSLTIPVVLPVKR